MGTSREQAASRPTNPNGQMNGNQVAMRVEAETHRSRAWARQRPADDRQIDDPVPELDDDLTALRPDDLHRVCRWVEDRLINAVTPLAIRLQLDMPGGACVDHTLLAAQWAVKRVLAAVDEVRRIVDGTRDPILSGIRETPSSAEFAEPRISN